MGISDILFLAAKDPDLISAGIIGFAFLLVIIFCIVARKTWNWVDITFTILSFIAGVAAIWGLTQVYSLRTADMAEVEKHQKAFDKATKEADFLIKGDPKSPTYDPGCLRAISGELTRELAGRGRVWSNGEVTADGKNRVFAFADARSDVVERPLVDVVVFAFLDRPVGGQNYPALYIGAVRVESETGANVTLSPLALAEPGEFAQPSGNWTLFEKMPLDRRGSFKQAAVALLKDKPNNSAKVTALLENLQKIESEKRDNIQGEKTDLDISLFRELLTSNYLPANLLGMDPNGREYEELIDMYAFDGLSINKIQDWIDKTPGRKTAEFEPPPEEVFILYEFQSDSKKPYTVDANSGSVDTDGLFTPLGLAVDQALHAGKEVEFKKGDTVLVDQRTADGYQRNGASIPPFKDNENVELKDRIYIRQVRDFPFEFADLREQTAKMAAEASIVESNNAIQTKSLADSRAQQAARDALMADLEKDRTALTDDLATIKRLLNDRSGETAALKQKVADLEARIRDSYFQLRGISVDRARRAFAGN